MNSNATNYRLAGLTQGIFGTAFGSFGLYWSVMAQSAGVPFWLFGLFFSAIGLVIAAVGFWHFLAPKRPAPEEPSNVFSGIEPVPPTQSDDKLRTAEQTHINSDFCPFCGMPVSIGYSYCRRCGKKLP